MKVINKYIIFLNISNSTVVLDFYENTVVKLLFSGIHIYMKYVALFSLILSSLLK